MDEKLKAKHANKSSFLCLCYILRAIWAGRCRERRYVDHIFIHIYFRVHHFVVKFSKFSSPQAARGHWPPPNRNPADVPACCCYSVGYICGRTRLSLRSRRQWFPSSYTSTMTRWCTCTWRSTWSTVAGTRHWPATDCRSPSTRTP